MAAPSPNARTHSKLTVCCLTAQQHAQTCGYWYLVQENCGPHTAFETISGLMTWLTERGLALVEDLPASRDRYHWMDIKGSYRTLYHGSYDVFFALQGERTRTLSNGDVTLAIITTDDDGLRTVHTLNPNCRDRPVWNNREDYQALR